MVQLLYSCTAEGVRHPDGVGVAVDTKGLLVTVGLMTLGAMTTVGTVMLVVEKVPKYLYRLYDLLERSDKK